MFLNKFLFFNALIHSVLSSTQSCYGMIREDGIKVSNSPPPIRASHAPFLNEIESKKERIEPATKPAKEREVQLNLSKGMTKDEIQDIKLKSEDWFTRNFTRCVVARLLIKENRKEEAEPYILAAYNEGFPAAILEYTSRDLNAGKRLNAQYLYSQACISFKEKYEEFDDQGCDNLVKKFKSFAKKAPELKDIYEAELKDHPLFKENESLKPIQPLNEKSIEFCERFKETEEELSFKELAINNQLLKFAERNTKNPDFHDEINFNDDWPS